MKMWITKDGTKIPFDQLKLSHIHNIIKYAKTKGFSKSYIAKSFVDNSDDVTISDDVSEQVISEMRNELKRRGYLTLYYVALVSENGLQRVSILFDNFADALQDIQNRKTHIKQYILVKEAIL